MEYVPFFYKEYQRRVSDLIWSVYKVKITEQEHTHKAWYELSALHEYSFAMYSNTWGNHENYQRRTKACMKNQNNTLENKRKKDK